MASTASTVPQATIKVHDHAKAMAIVDKIHEKIKDTDDLQPTVKKKFEASTWRFGEGIRITAMAVMSKTICNFERPTLSPGVS